MAKIINEGKKIFADKIRMIAKSIYDAADDIAGTTDGCTEIEVSFNIETETESGPELPTYTIVRRHYPAKELIEEFLDKMQKTAVSQDVFLSTEEKVKECNDDYCDI